MSCCPSTLRIACRVVLSFFFQNPSSQAVSSFALPTKLLRREATKGTIGPTCSCLFRAGSRGRWRGTIAHSREGQDLVGVCVCVDRGGGCRVVLGSTLPPTSLPFLTPTTNDGALGGWL